MDAGPTLEEPDQEWIVEPFQIKDSTKSVFYDNVTGFELDADLVKAARRKEMEFLLQLGVWAIVDVNEAWSVTGRPPITVSWVDINRGDAITAEYRSRLVVNETKRVSGHMDASEVFSATPPLEALRMQASLFMSLPFATTAKTPEQDIVWRFLDISRAHPNCPMRRDVYTLLPAEHPDYTVEGLKCGRLVMTLYGTRDAGQNFELTVFVALTDEAFERGVTNPCCYFHAKKQLSVYHHGDDFAIVGHRESTIWATEVIGKTFVVKDRGCLGPRSTDLKEILFLHRSVAYVAGGHGGERIEIAPDPRHAEILVALSGLNVKSKGVVTPGEKISMTDEMLAPLPEDEQPAFRSQAMRLGYLSLDRPDVQFPAKELARGLSRPQRRHAVALRRVVRYLLHAPNLSWHFPRQRWPKRIRTWSDTDWAGCPVTRRSSSGTCQSFGAHLWWTSSSTQTPISLSSGEAEFYGVVKAASRAIGGKNLAIDLGFLLFGELESEIATDSSAARGIASRRGTGRIRHLETGSLWVQAALQQGKFTLIKVKGTDNWADLGTKNVDRDTLQRLVHAMGLHVTRRRSALAPRCFLESSLMEPS